MNIKDILSVSGKPGLYKLLSSGKNSIIVESLDDKKRFPVYTAHQISALEEISIYTETEDKPLKEIFTSMLEVTEGKPAISHKSNGSELEKFFATILPDYDRERVYLSDIKKVIQWYNILLDKGFLHMEPEAEETAEAPVSENEAQQQPAAEE